jgi:hypothetical protein
MAKSISRVQCTVYASRSEGKTVPVHNMMSYKGVDVGSKTSRIFDLNTTFRRVATFTSKPLYAVTAVPKLCFADPNRSATSSQGIRGNISVTATLKFSISLITQWPRGLRRRSAAERLLGSLFRIPPGAWMFVSCECLCCQVEVSCDGPIPRPEESYRLWCVSECDQVKKYKNLDTYCE